jgi:hypothetical protein
VAGQSSWLEPPLSAQRSMVVGIVSLVDFTLRLSLLYRLFTTKDAQQPFNVGEVTVFVVLRCHQNPRSLDGGRGSKGS